MENIIFAFDAIAKTQIQDVRHLSLLFASMQIRFHTIFES